MNTIYVDMDGVLVDWEGTVFRLAQLYWDFKGEYKDLTQKQKMDLCGRTPRFYETLPWLQEGQWLWNYLRFDPLFYGRKKKILTAMSDKVPISLPEKYIWCDRNLSLTKEDVVVVTRKSHKRMWAVTDGQPNLLIDDNVDNCLQWIQAGGRAILFTTFQNAKGILEDIF